MEGDIEERMDRLENRLKTNFFEIEKRLVNLESSAPAALSERVHELEDLLLLLQLENMRIKEGLPSLADTPDKSGAEPEIENRLAAVEEKISAVKAIDVERLNKIEKQLEENAINKDDVNRTLKDLENSLQETLYRNVENIEKSVEKGVLLKTSDIERRFNDLQRRLEADDIEKRIKALEDALTLLSEASHKEASESVQELTAYVKNNIEARLGKLEAKPKSLDIDGKLDELKRTILDAVDNKLSGNSADNGRLDSIEKRIDELNNNVSIAVEESENISKTLERRLSSLEDRPEGSVETDSIEKEIGNIKRQLSALSKHVKKMDFLSKELSEVDKRLNSMELKEKPEKGTVLNDVVRILGDRNE
jgi:chromosome segregation ATPase